MQKFNEACIKTGDFAKLCNTNKRTLIHYDEIGLFSPEYIDEKGYRYYTESQADVFFTITCLKEIGMPLKEIKEFIGSRTPQSLKTLLNEQQKRVEQELEHLHRIKQVIQTKLALLEIGEGISFKDNLSFVRLEKVPEEYLIISPRLDTKDHEILINAVCQHIGECNRKNLNTGNPYGAMLLVDGLNLDQDDMYAHFFTKVSAPPKEIPYFVKPAGNYATIYLKGDYYEARQAYQELITYCKIHHLTMGEYCYKEAIWDEVSTPNKECYITKISVKV